MKYFSNFSTKTYAVSTQKNRLNAQEGSFQSFEHPKHMFKLIDKESITILYHAFKKECVTE